MANNSHFPGMQPLRPLMIGPPGPPQSALPSMSMQFRPVVLPHVAPSYTPVGSQQLQPIGHTGIGMPPPPPQTQFPQQLPQIPPRPATAGHGLPQAQAIPMPNFQPNRSVTPVPAPPQQNLQTSNSYMPGPSGPRLPLSSLYSLPSSFVGQSQINADSGNHYQLVSQTNIPSLPAGQPWSSTGNQSIKSVTPVQQTGEQSAIAASPGTVTQPDPTAKVPSEWIEHTSRAGKKYYFNRRTRLSTWEKPLELMTAVERADASTDWREFPSPDGRKYYYNKITNKSKWVMPDEVKLARERMNMESLKVMQPLNEAHFHAPAAVSAPSVKASPSSEVGTFLPVGTVPSPTHVAPVVNSYPVVTSASPNLAADISALTTDTSLTSLATPTAATPIPPVPDSVGTLPNSVTTPTSISEITPSEDAVTSIHGASPDIEIAKTGADVSGQASIITSEEKEVEQGPLVYESKLEAKNAFKVLLETANVGSDWTWDQAMRAIINDRRYGALKSLKERKQAFNEYVGQKKKQEAEERRLRQKKAREDFRKMLEESIELTSSTRWSKAISIFEDDERFKAVERAKDREDLFEDYIEELVRKERAKAMEEQKRHRMEYLEFLKSCDFIKASSQWRKVQDRLEADERCLRLEKIGRLEIFQEFIRELEQEEEEQRKLRMEELRKAERRNRAEFRKLMEEHVATGILTAKTHWRDYCMKVKDSPAYIAVSSNTSGSTAKDLFEDVAEELEKQYVDDKARMKDAIKTRKIILSSTWTLDDLKSAILKDISSPPISDVNIKLVFNELLERAREKEEKEAKRHKRIADDFFEFLHTSKEVTASSRWDDFKPFVEVRFGEEGFFLEIFEKFIAELKEKAREERKQKEEKAKKDKDRKDRQKKKEKQRRERERETESRKAKDRHNRDGTDSDGAESYSWEDNKRSGRDKDKKKRKRNSLDDTSLDENEKDRSRDSRRQRADRKKSKQIETSGADSENQYKRHKRDHRSGSHRNGDYKEHKEKEFSEDE